MKRKSQWIIIPILLTGIFACTLGQTPPLQTDPEPATVSPAESQPQPLPPPSGDVVNPADIEYIGAFRLPGGDEPPRTFAYGGNAMTFNPDGDPGGALQAMAIKWASASPSRLRLYSRSGFFRSIAANRCF